MNIEIDPSSGFCFGVIKAIGLAEQILEKEEKLYCLGDIVHNNSEVDRLTKKGLRVIDHEEFKDLRNCKVLIRAHGEPPETYATAEKNNITLVDGTCPVVLKLQQKIKKSHKNFNNNGHVIIYGKRGHAEVIGLSGQTENKAIIIESPDEIKNIELNGPVHLFSQTTMNKEGFEEIIKHISKKAEGKNIHIECTDSVCGQVSNRAPKIKKFCSKHDIVIFVSGRKSSNGKMLFEECIRVNKNSFFVSDKRDLNPSWFVNAGSVGICGATSTPRWQMEEISEEIMKIIK